MTLAQILRSFELYESEISASMSDSFTYRRVLSCCIFQLEPRWKEDEIGEIKTGERERDI